MQNIIERALKFFAFVGASIAAKVGFAVMVASANPGFVAAHRGWTDVITWGGVVPFLHFAFKEFVGPPELHREAAGEDEGGGGDDGEGEEGEGDELDEGEEGDEDEVDEGEDGEGDEVDEGDEEEGDEEEGDEDGGRATPTRATKR